ncbi:RNA-guided endonuclease InsQ/TnpB family protein [Actinomadura sp. NTSP31]|uniref:RNA-guided endonuclease InsQ/TnpB family protein n=1 Tax=Actinomadura sp. NTSP31 TaxID=1735447 RepID=UPI0035C0FDB4
MRMAYKCRAYPDPEQAALLARTFGCVRVVWNKTLAERSRAWRVERRRVSYKETDAALTAWKMTPDLAFLAEVSSVPLQQTLRHQHAAFQNFFAGRARYPRFKTRASRQSAHFTRSAFRMRGGELTLAKASAPLRFVWSWDQVDVAALKPTMVIVSRDGDGRWYVTFAVDADAPEPLPAGRRAIGIDLGVKELAVTSDGERIANPRHLKRKAENLARYQRRMGRCRKGSKNRAKAKAKICRAHRKVRAARADLLHRTTTHLVRDHDVIVIEDLNVKGAMAAASGTVDQPGRNVAQKRGLNRAIADCGWGEFRRQLEYKCERHGRRLVVIDRWHPSSKKCSVCGHTLAELSLSTRHWSCPGCRTRHDRDHNAAKNILAAGLAVVRGDVAFGDACGADVRHSEPSRVRSAVKQEASSVRKRIPAL